MKLGIFTNQHGLQHNSFIRRYCEDLHAGATVFSRHIIESNWNSENLISIEAEKLQEFLIRKRRKNALKKILLPFRRTKPALPPADPIPSGKRLWSDNVLFREYFTLQLKNSGITHAFTQYINHAIHLDPIFKELGIKHLARGHGYDITQVPKSEWGEAHYNKANLLDLIIVPTDYQKNILESLDVTTPKVISQVCGSDIPENFPQKTSNSEITQCISVGRFVEKKAPLLTIKSFLKAAETHPSMHLTMIGDGGLLQQCQEYVAEQGAEQLVRFMGSVDQSTVIEQMRRSDIFLQHSVTAENGDQEGAPVAISEAMANGLPVISTNHSGIPSMVKHEFSGLLVDEHDIHGMTHAIIRLTQNIKQRNAMAQESYHYAKQHLSWEREKKVILNELENL
ncbi:glycosyltransferase [Rubritalea sp.]|uniref:glycosyltransferase n=1 Tax=Rubritalea sp. TaxID=2109375 RepID=UPI003EF6DD0B